jgi:antitoxin ParD1/3/4
MGHPLHPLRLRRGPRTQSVLLRNGDDPCRRLRIQVTLELEKAVEAKVKSGLYHIASEVVSEALRAALAREQESEWLAREAAIGFAQLEAGQSVTAEAKEQFLSLVQGAA